MFLKICLKFENFYQNGSQLDMMKTFNFRFGSDVKIVHFLGDRKPWSYSYNRDTGRLVNPPTDNNELINHLTIWWSSLINNVFPKITDAESHVSHKLTLLMSRVCVF